MEGRREGKSEGYGGKEGRLWRKGEREKAKIIKGRMVGERRWWRERRRGRTKIKEGRRELKRADNVGRVFYLIIH